MKVFVICKFSHLSEAHFSKTWHLEDGYSHIVCCKAYFLSPYRERIQIDKDTREEISQDDLCENCFKNKFAERIMIVSIQK
jgi:hypothetical protein